MTGTSFFTPDIIKRLITAACCVFLRLRVQSRTSRTLPHLRLSSAWHPTTLSPFLNNDRHRALEIKVKVLLQELIPPAGIEAAAMNSGRAIASKRVKVLSARITFVLCQTVLLELGGHRLH